ncbi:MAG: OmpA family protein [Saprospiraceae bacterium]
MKFPLFLLLLGCATISNAQKNFRVQLTAFETQVSLDYFANLENVWTEEDHNELHHYYLADFATQAEAEEAVSMAKSKGYPHAHVLDLAARAAACECSKPADDYLRHLFFDFDQADLRFASQADLRKLAKVMRDNPTYRLKLVGHTDSKGTDNYNTGLSARRAENAQVYLRNMGVALERMSIEYKGELAPIAVNQYINGQDAPQGRQLNRRVVVQITDAEGKPLSNLVEEIKVPVRLKMT